MTQSAPEKSQIGSCSFSMDKNLYKDFKKQCQERGYNASALIRNFIASHMESAED